MMMIITIDDNVSDWEQVGDELKMMAMQVMIISELLLA